MARPGVRAHLCVLLVFQILLCFTPSVKASTSASPVSTSSPETTATAKTTTPPITTTPPPTTSIPTTTTTTPTTTTTIPTTTTPAPIEPGKNCSENDQCVVNASCSEGICECAATHYASNGTCRTTTTASSSLSSSSATSLPSGSPASTATSPATVATSGSPKTTLTTTAKKTVTITISPTKSLSTTPTSSATTPPPKPTTLTSPTTTTTPTQSTTTTRRTNSTLPPPSITVSMTTTGPVTTAAISATPPITTLQPTLKTTPIAATATAPIATTAPTITPTTTTQITTPPLITTTPSAPRKAGEKCSKSDQCVENASCTEGTCQCAATHFAKDGTCQPRLSVGQTCTNTTQCVPDTECDDTDAGKQCRIPAGSTVSCGGDSDKCVTTAVCESNTCKTKVGETCSASNSTDCKNGTECADTGNSNFQCRLSVGQTCTNTTQCVPDTECDDTDAGKQCRIPAGSAVSCGGDSDKCVTTAVCESNTCKTKVGETCSASNSTYCKNGTECADRGNSKFQCQLSVGQTCTNTTQCVPDTECDDTDAGKQCRISAGSAVSCGGDSDKCVTTAVCESNTCKTKVGETCSASNSTYCKNGTECADTGNSKFQCRLSVGRTCTNTTQCVPDMECDDTDAGKQCRITAGSAVSCGGDSDKCVTTAVCESNTCKTKVGETCSSSNSTYCKNGTECADRGNSKFQCRLSVGQTCTNTTQCVPDTECDDTDAGKQCRIPAGSAVSCGGDSDKCVTTAVCESNTCKTKVGETCSASNSTYCKNGTECADTGNSKFQCRLSVGRTCTNTTQCVPDMECDDTDAGKQCRITAGSAVSCGGDSDKCVTTAVCESNTCKTKVGETCSSSNSTYCKNGTECADRGNSKFQCRLSVGQTCTNTTQCVPDTECDDTDAGKQCRIPAGSAVSCGGDSDKCVTTAVCESNTCKTKVGETCSASNSTYCKNGTECADTGNSNFQCRLSVGQTCTNTTQCVPDTECDDTDAGKQCRISAGGAVSCGGDSDKCVTTAVCESNTCKTKVGETCSNSNPDHCQTDAECVNTGSNNYHCRKKYGTQCYTDSECQTSQRQTCVNMTSGSSLCLCDDQSFRHSDQCESVTRLTATQLKMLGTHQETSINVTWTLPEISAEYQATLNNSQKSDYGDMSMYTFTGLTQGKDFTFFVTSRKERNPGHNTTAPEYATVVSGAVLVYTRPAQPGPLLSNTLPGPNVTLTFTASAGHVDSYSVTATPQKPLHTAVTVNSSMNSVVIPGLVAGEYYNVSITAISNNIDSAVRTDTFRVKSQPADPVSNLTQKAQSSRWTELKWNRPVNPNGVISGYTVRVVLESDQQSCISGVAVNCSDCVYNSTEVIPDTSTCTHSTVKTLTKAELNDESFVVEVNVTQLKPYVQYQVEAMAYNEEGAGHPDSLTFLTDSEAADDLVAMEVSAPAIGQLLVSWRPGEERGETNYTVTWEEQDSLLSQSYTQHGSHLLQGYDARNYTIQGLLSYWNYRVTVTTVTTVGPAPVPTTVTNRTLESKPGQVQNLSLTQSDDDATKITMTIICPTERERNGHLVEFRYNSTVTYTEAGGVPQRPEGSVKVSGNCGTLTKVLPVTAQTSYNVSVYAVTESGLKGEDSASTITIQARPPTVIKKPTSDLMSEKEEKSETSVTVTVQRDQIFSDEQGRLEIAGMLVCQKRGPQSCQRGPDKTSDDFKNPSKTPTWGRNRKSQDSVYYRATPDNFQDLYSGGRSRRSVGSALGRERRDTGSFQFIIGSDTSCPELSDDVYCNGPLEPGQQYLVVVFSCTKGGCSETTEPSEVTTKEKEDEIPIGAIVGGIVAAVAAFIVVIIIVVIYRRRRRPKKETETEGPMGEPPVTIEIPVVRKPVMLRDFTEHLANLHRDSNLLFQADFEDITKNSPSFSQEAATLDANKVKNRYVNILAFDRTRVKLLTDEDDPTADYINANYIPGYSSPREYIATQGPMTGTVNDFWRMVWEQNSALIVQLSDLLERGRPKVDLYWPTEVNSPMQYGEIIVTMTALSSLNKYTIRNFIICMENNMEERRQVTQFFIHGWVDYSANLNPKDVMDYIRTVRLEAKRNPSRPIIVHCSAGVGRSGTFIALDFLQQYVDDHTLDDVVDIYNLVLNMRHNRPLMVQTEAQYVFIHDTLKMIVDTKIEMMKADEENIYQNQVAQDDDNVYANQGFETEENVYQNTEIQPTDPTTSL
ncbi:uncharacterized protein LOC143298338 isoform X2 [Babylonia areolata]|uniref:uncharacterized protein LOC143298338 isoform X2 n=1 Tax=Babylonia areolata TaxID=304850 RepID=UPI003FD68940